MATVSFTNRLKPQVDLPVWEWTRFAPAATSTPSAAISDWQSYFVGGTPRYAYYMNAAALYRYDTLTDSWNSLATYGVTPVYSQAVDYCPAQGYFGRAIGPGPGKNTIQLAGLQGNTLAGYKIAIIGGTGAGQEKTIVNVRDPVVADYGFVVAYSNAGGVTTIGDTTTLASRKTWLFNQWRDYQVRITFASGTNTGQNQIRRILYNSNNQLTLTDYTHAALHSWYSAPLTTALTALTTWYQIESSIVEVDSNWVIPPDNTSKFVIKGGGLWMHTGLATGAFYTLAYYDILADTWYNKGTQTATLGSATWANYENSIEAVTEAEAGKTTNWVHTSPLTQTTGAISTGTGAYAQRTLIDASQTMRLNQFANQMIKITSGAGAGQCRTIVGNNATTFIISRDWDVLPNSTSSYQVIGDSDKLYITPSNKQSVMGIYSVENDVVTTGRQFDFGVVRTLYVDLAPQGIAAVTVTGGSGGASYVVGDILTLTNNGLNYGTGATVQVATLSGSAVATVNILTVGNGYPSSSAAYTTTGGTGTGCTLVVSANSMSSQPPIGATGAVKSSGGLLTVSVNTAGTGYSVGDLLTFSSGGGIVRVTSVTNVGGLSTIAIEAQGSAYSASTTNTPTYTTSTVKNATASDGAIRPAAASAVINIVSITDYATVTTGINHNFKIGDTVNIGGLDLTITTTGQAYYGGLKTIVSVPTATTFTYNIAGAGQSAAAQVTPVISSNFSLKPDGTGAVVLAGGSGYHLYDTLTISGGGGNATARVVALNGSAVSGICLLNPGTGYSSGTPATTVSPSGGSGCTITTTAAATGTCTTLTVTNAGQGFGVITNNSTTAPTYAVGTGLASVSVYNSGSGYAVGDLLSVAGTASGGAGGIVKVLTVTSAGSTPAGGVLTVLPVAFGQGYATGQGITTTTLGNTYAAGFSGSDGGGSGCTLSIDVVGSVYEAGAGTGLWVNVNSVNSTSGAITGTPTVVYSGSGYSAAAQNMAGGTSGIFNAEASSTSLIVDLHKNWQPNELVGKLVQTQLGGVTATAQMRRIIANSSHAMLVQPVITNPTVGGTKYVIFDNKSLGTEASYKSSDPSQYSWGIATTGSTSTLQDAGTGLNQVAVVVGGATGAYAVGDILTLGTGTGGTVKVKAVTAAGLVTDISVVTQGTGYTAATTYATTSGNQGSGNGTGCTIYVSTTNSKNWDVNRWAGYKVKIIAGTGVNSNPNELLIASNTTNTLTLATNFTFSAAPDATTVYAIMDNWGVCTGTTTNGGIATITSYPTAGTGYRVGDILLVTTGVGAFLKVTSVSAAGGITGAQILNNGSGFTAVTVNTTCLTNGGSSGTGTAAVATMTNAGSLSLFNDVYQSWGLHGTAADAPLVTKVIRAVAGSPVTGLDSAISQLNFSTQIQVGTALGTAPDGNTAYSILARMPLGGAGSLGVSSLHRLYGTTVVEPARYMVSWRGNNTPTIDRYDIVQDIWETLSGTPLSELYSLGSMFIYNGTDRIYFTTSVTGRVQYYDFTKNIIVPCSTVPYGMGAGILGSRMFMMSTSDLKSATTTANANGLEYLYVMRHSGTGEMWRALIYW